MPLPCVPYPACDVGAHPDYRRHVSLHVSYIFFCDCWQATEDTAYVDDDGVRKLKANPLQIGGLLVAQIGGFAILALIGRALGKSS